MKTSARTAKASMWLTSSTSHNRGASPNCIRITYPHQLVSFVKFGGKASSVRAEKTVTRTTKFKISLSALSRLEKPAAKNPKTPSAPRPASKYFLRLSTNDISRNIAFILIRLSTSPARYVNRHHRDYLFDFE